MIHSLSACKRERERAFCCWQGGLDKHESESILSHSARGIANSDRSLLCLIRSVWLALKPTFKCTRHWGGAVKITTCNGRSQTKSERSEPEID
ncbi:hypothetical protein CEXT_729071 [Caerostris extrusa]|uniref:Uncharacterized protein n=1 Tax=Caerostris extrusa TaxID=172846 RepID=A0AAV4PFB1_CAEEX|nr:hypothetical protein CEXT_729071 [Caerostris extrusa]